MITVINYNRKFFEHIFDVFFRTFCQLFEQHRDKVLVPVTQVAAQRATVRKGQSNPRAATHFLTRNGFQPRSTNKERIVLEKVTKNHFKQRCHILFTHAFSVLRCIFEELTMVDENKMMSSKIKGRFEPWTVTTQDNLELDPSFEYWLQECESYIILHLFYFQM